MDGSFACPECGSNVEVHGLAPGRQVRCEFCQRLLEVPYLPRAADPSWKRRRFRHPKWVRRALIALGMAAALIIVTGSVRFLKKHHDSTQKRSINRLLESSRQHEGTGDLNQALIDLDAALDLAQQSDPVAISHLADYKKKRSALARREVEATLDRLRRHDPSAFPMGDWLTLIARLPRDPDLASLIDPITNRFQAALRREVDSQLEAARRLFESNRGVEASKLCDRIAGIAKHLSSEVQSTWQSDTQKLMTEIVTKHGLIIQPIRGTFVFGSQKSYVSDLMPILINALESRGYLPYRESSAWQDTWSHAPYQAGMEITERLEGSYLSSQNRLTWIEAKLSLTSRSAVFWQSTPTARSSVPLPELSTYVSSRVAAVQKRSEEIEKLLYANARGQIEDRFKRNLGNMPPCPQSATP